MKNYLNEAKNLSRLASPVIMANVAQNAMGFIDLTMAGNYGDTDLAAIGTAASIWVPTILFGWGLLMAIVPIVAHLMGSGRSQQVPFQIHQATYLALFISVPIILVLYSSNIILSRMSIEPLLEMKALGYLHAVTWSVPAFLLFLVLRGYAEGLSYTRPAMVIGWIGLLLNIPLNWIFINGKFGMPELGGVGCGVATAIVYWAMFFCMLFYTVKSKRLNYLSLFTTWSTPSIEPLMRLFKLGLPIAINLFLEVTLFVGTAYFIAPLGTAAVAGHQVALNFSSLMFILPLSISIAVSIRVSHQLGDKNVAGALISTRVGLFIGISLSIITAICTILYRSYIIGVYNVKSVEVFDLAMELLLIAGFYQCADAIQVVAGGALRGYKDMTTILKITAVCYWCVAFPIGYCLAMTDLIVSPLGPVGFWYGFIIGLSTAAFALGLRLFWLQRQPDAVQLQFASH